MKTRYKCSVYNIFDHIKDHYYSLYNSRLGKHLILNLNDSCPEKSVRNNMPDIDLLPDAVFDKLLEKGFIVGSDLDECRLYEDEIREKRSNDYGLYLNILPTLSCNFDCIYCYEIKSDEYMSENVQNSIIRFIEQKYESGTIKGDLNVNWFGGEPFLAFKTILSLNNKIIDNIVSKYNIKYASTAATNGSKLNVITDEMINLLHLKSITVSLDGPEKIHNCRRPHKSGMNVYNEIIQNIKRISCSFHNLKIKITIDKENAQYIFDFLCFLKNQGILDKCSYELNYFSCEVGIHNANCIQFNADEIFQFEDSLYKRLKETGIRKPVNYPSSPVFDCLSHYHNYYVINPLGNVFKCPMDASINNRSVFNITQKTPTDEQRKNYERYLKFSYPEICLACKYKPMCMGNCIGKKNDKNIQFCPPYINSIRDNLVSFAKERLSEIIK